jgi:DNA polymerase III delta subunit
MKYLPNDKRLNLYQQHPFVQKKVRENAARFQLRELMQALDQLLKINTALVPSQKDLYVPDVQLMLETFIVGFCEGAGARR